MRQSIVNRAWVGGMIFARLLASMVLVMVVARCGESGSSSIQSDEEAPIAHEWAAQDADARTDLVPDVPADVNVAPEAPDAIGKDATDAAVDREEQDTRGDLEVLPEANPDTWNDVEALPEANPDTRGDLEALPEANPDTWHDVEALPEAEPDSWDAPEALPEADALDPCAPPHAGSMCPCQEDDDCDSGYCVHTNAGKVCTTPCTDTCEAPGWRCAEAPSSCPDCPWICVFPLAALCQPCAADADCNPDQAGTASRCLSYGPEGNFCGGPCGGDGDCPTGYRCDHSGSDGQCMLEQGVCGCSAFSADNPAVTDCARENPYGTCSGHRRCTPQGLTQCDAPIPAAEACNGQDDNCDGQVDEGFPCRLGAFYEEACGNCGRRSVACNAQCQWEPGSCGSEGECAPGDFYTKPCGNCGNQTVTCDDTCHWWPATCDDHTVCPPCTADCTGRDCGDDGCGGSCGACGAHQACALGACVDLPWCGDGACLPEAGEDCGTCEADCACGCGQACQAGVCAFTACDGVACGDDGCGGSCGSCGLGTTCDAGQCVASVCPANVSSPLGTNLDFPTYWSSERPFVDAFKLSRPWVTSCADCQPNVWDTHEASALDLDDKGWVRTLPPPSDPAVYTSVVTTMFTGIGGHYPAGQYIVLYDGQGTMQWTGATRNAALSTPGRDVLDVVPTAGGITLRITATDPESSGNYLRNIRVILPGFEATHAAQIFDPEFLKKTERYRSLRFLMWQNTIGSTHSDWAKRTPVDAARWSDPAGQGVPLEIMVALCNRLHAEPWFTLPSHATDDYFTQFATFVRDHLAPDLKATVEYSDEIWNGAPGFTDAAWVQQQAVAKWPGSPESGFTKQTDWYGMRTAQMCDLWKSAFGADAARVVCVMGGQSGNAWFGGRALDCPLWTEGAPCSQHGIDALAIGPYFGGYLGASQFHDQVLAWTTEGEAGMTKLFTELTQGGQLTGGPTGGAIARAASEMAANKTVADARGVRLVAYEGGSHLDDLSNTAAIESLFAAAGRDPRMGQVYATYLAQWKTAGGELFAHFKNISYPFSYGSFGALEYTDEPTSAKYAALQDFMQGTPCWWSGCEAICAGCQPACAGKSCGPDGCGGTCGTCGSLERCSDAGACVCVPQCANKSCGPDGCGGTCGTCGSSQTCTSSGQCLAADLRPLGTYTQAASATACGPTTSVPTSACYTFTVSGCADVAPMTGRLKVSDPVGVPKGTVVLGAGGGGGAFYEIAFGNASATNQLLVPLVANGYRVVQRAWNGSGWTTGPSTGFSALACRYATMMQGIYDHVHTGGALCVTGNSGGASEIGYALAHYGLGRLIDLAVPTSGPPMGRIDHGCLATNDTAWIGTPPAGGECQSLLSGCGYTSCYYAGMLPAFMDQAYAAGTTACQTHDPAWAATWLADSVVAPGRLFTYPETDVRFLFGATDCSESVAFGRLFYNAITTTKSQATVPGTPHELGSTDAGAAEVLNALQAGCVVHHATP